MTKEEIENLEEFRKLQDEFTRFAFAMRRYSVEIVEHMALREYNAIPIKLENIASHYNMGTEVFKRWAKLIDMMESKKQLPGTVS